MKITDPPGHDPFAPSRMARLERELVSICRSLDLEPGAGIVDVVNAADRRGIPLDDLFAGARRIGRLHVVVDGIEGR